MVKKYIAIAFIALFAVGGILVGCNKTGALVTPANASVLKLTIPKSVWNVKPHSSVKVSANGVHALDSVPDDGQGTLEYCITTPGEIPVKGSINYTSGSDVGTVTISLPKAGKWVVAAEWFSTQVEEGVVSPASKVKASAASQKVPEFAGADVVDIEGTTSFTLNMEDFWNEGYSCYYTGSSYPGYLVDSGYAECQDTGSYGFYAFNQGLIEFSGDVQVEFNSTANSEYLTTGGSAAVSFAYVGTGDLVNFATLPDNANFYATTLAAKAAVVGQANQAIQGNDVYVVKGVLSTDETNDGRAWIQIDPNSIFYCPTEGTIEGGELNFWFIYNGENLNYMKFDETTDGANNCNENNEG